MGDEERNPEVSPGWHFPPLVAEVRHIFLLGKDTKYGDVSTLGHVLIMGAMRRGRSYYAA